MPNPSHSRIPILTLIPGLAEPGFLFKEVVMFQKILVPLDGSPAAEQALPLAAQLADRFAGDLLLVRVIPAAVHPPARFSMADTEVWLARHGREKQEAEAYLDQLARSPELHAVGARWLVCEGSDVPARVLETVQEHALDAIVIATRGRSGIARLLLGSVAQQIVERSPVPVVVAPTGSAS
jgi:nucleotide-binding universal stress UspA family protein